ncbi:MAG: transketolase C-terminal domain-containing protein [Chloroflexota bacterium]
MTTKRFIDANFAVAHGVRLARAEVVAAYPITPQTSIVEHISSLIANGEMDADYIKVESEHSAMAACFGACTVGCRSFTASSSQGLEYMHEMLAYVSGGRFPVVMATVNRSVALPWSIMCDHQDSIQQRDTGWIQLYLETGQEALDMVIQAYRIAEDPRVMTPVMLCLDGFALSHTNEPVEIPDQADVDRFLPPFQAVDVLDPARPVTLGAGFPPAQYAGYRFRQQQAMEAARAVIPEVSRAFAETFGRDHGGLVDAYRCDGAEVILVVAGSVAGTAREAIDSLRADGVPAGLAKVRSLRPFPVEELRQIAHGVEGLAVIDRDCSFGMEGAIATDFKASLYDVAEPPLVRGYIAGLGGKDVRPEDIREMLVSTLADARAGIRQVPSVFHGVQEARI